MKKGLIEVKMKKVLIVDDDITVVRFLKDLVSQKLHLPCESATSLVAVKKHLNKSDQFAIALVDVILPDAKDAEAIDEVIAHEIPVIAMTSSKDEDLNDFVKSKDILDFVNKENPGSFDYAMRLLLFVYGFKGSQILIVDDSKTSRLQLRLNLDKLPLEVFEAENGKEALEVLKRNPEIQLIITDQKMPVMTGIELVQEVRKTSNMSELSIIGISASNDNRMSVEFLKNGANDFLTKPFLPEEVLSRIINSLEMQYYVRLAQESAVRDFLTGLHNRKYLYETGLKLYANAKREHLSIVVAMIDIDYFKKINDRYGHQAGDEALKLLGKLFLQEFRDSDIVTRYGGEEFCIILTNTQVKHAVDVMNIIREKVENMKIQLHNLSFRMTVSIGLTSEITDSFDQMLDLADKQLYKAKNNGRNQVVF